MTLGAGMVPMPPIVRATVALAPVDNILMSMMALRDPEEYGGMDDWVVNTAAQLPADLRTQHTFWMKWFWLDLLTNAVERGPAFATFPAYLTALAQQDPKLLRDRLLYWMVNSPHLRVYAGGLPSAPLTPLLAEQLLNDVHYFTTWTLERFTEKPNPAELADLPTFHALLNQPAQLQSALVAHLRRMWEEVVAVEWARIAPRLQRCVDAFQAVSLAGLTILDAMQVVTGRDLRPIFRPEALWRYHRVCFIPTIHNGPYVVWYGNEEELRVGFPAHEPALPQDSALRFDQSTLVNRCKALADETRLAMLWALREAGELSTQEVIDRFALDKSAASRHLRQLVATNLIEERRADGAKKVYSLNGQAIDAITQMLHALGRARPW